MSAQAKSARKDGGPAFCGAYDVVLIRADGPDDPVKIEVRSEGMSLRDHFAGLALQGFLADSSQRLIAAAIDESPQRNLIQDTKAMASIVNEQLARGCYAIADSMLAAREGGAT